MRYKSIETKVAQDKGYDSWDGMFDFICREGERPEVSAQLIQGATKEYIKLVCDRLENQSFQGWTDGEKSGYLTALKAILRSLEE